MKILVTGGSGFLGAHLIPRLVSDGHEVFALARSPSSDEKLRGFGATPVRGDLEAPGGLALPVVDAVVHAAAHFRLAGPRAPYFRTNVAGTQALLKAAQEAGAKTFVHVSAAAVVMDDKGSPMRGADESAPTFPNSFPPTSRASRAARRRYWQRTSRASARSHSARPASGGRAMRLAAQFRRPLVRGSSPSSIAVIIPSSPAMSTMWSRPYSARSKVGRADGPISSMTRRR